MKEVFQTVVAILIAQAIIYLVSKFTRKTIMAIATIEAGADAQVAPGTNTNKAAKQSLEKVAGRIANLNGSQHVTYNHG